mgnify:CR=1 FL=1
MPATVPASRNQPLWQLIALVLVTAIVVAVPAMVLRAASERLQAALDAVAHTYDVKATAYELLYVIREAETAALVLNAGVETPQTRPVLRENVAATRRLVRDLARLTRDNPDQQVRIGALGALLASRMQAAEDLAALPVGSHDTEAVRRMALESRIRQPALEIIENETRLVDARVHAAEALRRQASVLRWGAVLAQLLLLGGLVYVWQRQMSGRLSAERETRRASARAQAVLQTVREPIVLVDGKGCVLMHNTAFAELYGEPDATRRLLREIGDGAWSDPVMTQRLDDVIGRGRELWDHEHPQRTRDGVQRTMLVSARQMELPDVDDKVVLVLASDITVRKATEAQLQDLNRQLEGKVEQVSEVNRELEAFSYSVSHDLRAPLRHVAGFADKLARHLGDEADEKSTHYIEVIGSSARRMSQLIDDLLIYSRLGRGAMQLKAVDMQSMVAETRAILDANLASDAPGRRVSWSIAPLPMVVADENMLRTVWLNLLGNAVKYSARVAEARVEVGYEREDDGTHHFHVRDNGAGFEMQYAGKLFGVFQRMHKASEFPGTGIGLASVRRVLTRHGGRIWAESTPDVGSTFHFTLPASLDAPSSNANPTP